MENVNVQLPENGQEQIADNATATETTQPTEQATHDVADQGNATNIQAPAPEQSKEVEKPLAEMFDCFYVEIERSEKEKVAKLVQLKRTVPLSRKEAGDFNDQFNLTGYNGEIYLPAGEQKVGNTFKL